MGEKEQRGCGREKRIQAENNRRCLDLKVRMNLVIKRIICFKNETKVMWLE